uniref:Uncharacterized protein n=1 Tax=Leersia perrieri TaxID=77586 RepID=A0A0D9XX91_9ORYZ
MSAIERARIKERDGRGPCPLPSAVLRHGAVGQSWPLPQNGLLRNHSWWPYKIRALFTERRRLPNGTVPSHGPTGRGDVRTYREEDGSGEVRRRWRRRRLGCRAPCTATAAPVLASSPTSPSAVRRREKRHVKLVFFLSGQVKCDSGHARAFIISRWSTAQASATRN